MIEIYVFGLLFELQMFDLVVFENRCHI